MAREARNNFQILEARRTMSNIWDERYASEEYLFGTEPNAFLVSQRHLLKHGMRCLAVADGEGRNGVWLAGQVLDVLSVDASPVAAAKAHKLAVHCGVDLKCEVAELLDWDWGENRYDIVVAIFIQFATHEQRDQLFANIKRTLKPGGLLLLQGYTPRQLECGTGGPSQADNLYTVPMLRNVFLRHGNPAAVRA